MMDEELIDKEFENKCLKERTIKISPTVTFIEQEGEKRLLVNQHKNNSNYFLEGAQNLLKSSTPLLSILMGYFAMEHKANQLLVINGYKVESHICTQMALSRVLNKKNLARDLSEVFEQRQNIGYRMFLKHNEEESENAKEIINGKVIHFVKEVNGLIEEAIK